MSEDDLTWTSFNPRPENQGTPTSRNLGGEYETGGSLGAGNQAKFWNNTNIFIGLAVLVGGFLVVLFTKLNSMEKDQDIAVQKIERNDQQIENMSDDVKEMKYLTKEIGSDVKEIKDRLRRK